jgi:hypothetical protein
LLTKKGVIPQFRNGGGCRVAVLSDGENIWERSNGATFRLAALGWWAIVPGNHHEH